MNKMKRLSALVCAGALVMSTVPAYAAVTSNGNGAVENLGEQGVSFDSIVLPTMPDGTYDFTLDPQKLLQQYGGAAYASGDTVIFNNQKDAAKLELAATVTDSATDKKIYYETKVKESDTTNLKAAITADGADSISAVTAGFFVWTPDTSSAEKIAQGAGKWVELTKDNIKTYVDITISEPTPGTFAVGTVTMHSQGGTQDDACDGQVYKNGWADLGTNDVNDYVTVGTDGAITIKEGVKLAYKQTAGTAVELDATKLTYTAATRQNTNTSDKAKIVNKSSSDKVVKVKVSVTNGDGLEFTNGTTLDTSKASLYLAITDGTTSTYVEKKENADTKAVSYTAVASFAVAKPTTTAVTYMAGVDDKTGGHIYNSYLAADMTYNSQEFYLEGVANSDAAGKDAWDAYAQSLRTATTTVKPGITVVYDIYDDVTKLTITDELKASVSWANDGWAWFDLGATDAPSKVQLVANEGTDDEVVYALKSSDYYMSDSFIGVNPAKAGGPEKLTALIEVGAKVYKMVLW